MSKVDPLWSGIARAWFCLPSQPAIVVWVVLEHDATSSMLLEPEIVAMMIWGGWGETTQKKTQQKKTQTSR